jgi:glycosyltransferase involved in cell wall biosynthesis
MKHLDIIVPCFNEEECVVIFFSELSAALEPLYEITWTVYFVDDGSYDKTLVEIKKLVAKYDSKRVKYVSFTRNFGKEAAIYAGLKASKGQLIALMDCDLQDPPSMLLKMISGIHEGYECVATRRVDRKGEPALRSWLSRMFYGFMNRFSIVKLEPGARDFRMMTSQMRDSILNLSETERFSKGLFSWLGYNTKWLEYSNVKRAAGRTSWSLVGLFIYAGGGYMDFSSLPLKLTTLIGFSTLLFTTIYLIYRLMRYGLFFSTSSVLILLVLSFNGITLLLNGITAEYIARMYNEVKQRPIYIAKESNVEDDT